MKIGRWQRLWVLWSVIYLVPPILFLFEDLSTKKKMEWLWIDNTIEIAKKQLDPYWTNGEISLYEDLTNQGLVKRIHEKYGNDRWSKLSFEKVDQEYRDGLKNLNYKHLKFCGIAFLFWIVPVISVYILGKGVSWVYSGFKSS
jgi:hypothetical protein